MAFDISVKGDFNILLMVQKSGVYQLRLIVYPTILWGLGYIPGGCLGFLNLKKHPFCRVRIE